MKYKVQKIKINEIEERYLARVKYILSEIGYRIGIKFIVSEDESSLIYSPIYRSDIQKKSIKFNSDF